MSVPQVDIVVPVRNEEHDLAPSIRLLVGYLRGGFPFTARVTIADNGSTDRTWAIADQLARDLPEVRAVRLEQPGSGRAGGPRGGGWAGGRAGGGGRCAPSGRRATPRSWRTWMSTCRQI